MKRLEAVKVDGTTWFVSNGNVFDFRGTAPESPATCKAVLRALRARRNRQARDEAYRSCGMVKVRGALGGTYWE